MSWQQVLGHDVVVASFESAWKRGRLAHAYLFVGPHGVGKHTFAGELAKALLCENRPGRLEACGQCAACHLVAAGTHPDLFMVARPEDKVEFPIEVIRDELLPNLAMKPARGGRKVAIVDDADDLNEEAANCFLKTLEEPPPASVLMLIGGASAERQMPTIVSRCQIIRFAPIAPALVKRLLGERGVADPARQERLLQLAEGCPGQALALDDEEVWAFRAQLIDTLRRPTIDPADTTQQWMKFIESAGTEGAVQRPRAALIFRMLLVLLDTALRLSLGAQAPGLDAGEERALRDVGGRLGEERLLAWIERALEADRQVDRRVQLVLVIEAFVDAISRA
jgi:DNA polymerase III subunit delta'